MKGGDGGGGGGGGGEQESCLRSTEHACPRDLGKVVGLVAAAGRHRSLPAITCGHS